MTAPRPSLSRQVARAAVRPATLSVVGLGAVLTAGLGALAVTGFTALPAAAVGALTVLTWGALTAWDTLTVRGAPRAGIPVPELQQGFEAVRAAADRVREAMDAASEVLQPHLSEPRAQCAQLLDEARTVAERGARLHAFLASVSPASLEKERQALLERARRSRNAEAAETWRQAAMARSQQVENWRQIEGLYDRVRAELAALGGAMDDIRGRIVRMTASEPEDALAASQSMRAQLDSLQSSVGVLEKAVEATLKEVGP